MSTRFARRRRKTASEKSGARTSSRQRKIARFDSSSAFASFIYDMKAGRYYMPDSGINRYTIKGGRWLVRTVNRYTIKGGRWLVRTDRPEELIAMETEDGKLIVVHYNDLRVDGRSVEKICIKDMYPRGRCFTASDIRSMVTTAISKLLNPWLNPWPRSSSSY